MYKSFISLFFLGWLGIASATAQQVMLQGWYWDYPKTGQSTVSSFYNWSDTLRLKAQSLSQAGFTHVWYPPFAGNGNRSGGYDPKDLFVGPSQTSLGTLSEIKSMVNSMTAVGITPVADMVYNHRDGGVAETNPAVKDYITTFAGNSTNSNDNPNCGFKQPFPSDRYRMIIPLGGTLPNGVTIGAGKYYIKIRSRTNIYDGTQYVFHATTEKLGGSRWNPNNSSQVDLTAGFSNPRSVELGRNYLNRLWSSAANDEFEVTVTANDFNVVGDKLILEAINLNGNYSNHTPTQIYYLPEGSGTSYNIANINTPFDQWYKLEFQTFTNFNNMPSGRGGLDWNGFRPHFTSSSRAGWSQTTCLGPQYSMQSLDYFYDYDHNITSTKDLLVDWTKWAFDELGSKGLRMDAVKHFEPTFVSTMLNEMRGSGRTPNFVVGEWYGTNRAELKGWVDAVYNGLNTDTRNNVQVRVFDFALRDALKQALDNDGNARNAYFNSLRFAEDGNNFSSGNNIVTFLNNHDFRSDNSNYGDALIFNNPELGYAWLLTNNQLGIPTVFYPDYYGYPAHNTTYGSDPISFSYHPTALKPLKSQIDLLMKIQKQFIYGSTQMSFLNHYGGIDKTPGINASYSSGDYNKALIYQLSSVGAVGGKDVIVAINFGGSPLKVNHKIDNSRVSQGTHFGDVLGRSNFPYAIVNNDAGITNSIYIDLPAKSYTVWVQDYEPLSATLTSTTTCAGQSNTLTAALTGGTAPFTYSFSAGTQAIPGSTSLVSTTSAGVYSVTITDSFGASVTATVNSSFNQPPIPAVSGNLTICNGASTTLTASGGNTYLWSTTESTSAISVTPTTTTPYNLTVTSVSGCSSTTAVTVEVSSTPTPGISGNLTICNGASTTLTASGGNSYRWNTNSTAASLVVSPTSPATYTVTVTTIGGCSATTAVTVSVVNAPTVTVSPTSSTVAAGQSVSLQASGALSFIWSTGELTTQISATSAEAIDRVYSVTGTSNGCSGTASAAISFTAPCSSFTALQVAQSGWMCNGIGSVNITATTSGATSYSLIGPSGSQSIPNGFATVTQAGTYTVLASNGTCVVPKIVTVVNTSQTPSVANLISDGVLSNAKCSARLIGVATGTAFVIQGPNGYVFSNVYRTLGTYNIFANDAIKPGTYWLTVYLGGCQLQQSVTVTGTSCN